MPFVTLLCLLSVSPQFASQGTWMPGGSLSAAYAQSKRPAGRAQSQVDLNVAPNVLYFVADRWAVGTTFLFTYNNAIDPLLDERLHTLGGGLAPTVGYALPLTQHLSLLGRLWLGYALQHVSPSAQFSATFGAAESLRHVLSVGGSAWALLHLTSHVFVGAGPEFGVDVLSKLSHDTGNYVDDRKSWKIAFSGGFGVWI